MKTPTNILYPRGTAVIGIVDSNLEKSVNSEIRSFEESKDYKNYLENKNKLRDIQLAKSKFTCWKCGNEKKTRDITVYCFVSYCNNADEDRYEDYNIVCESCGAFSYLNDVSYPFKNIQRIQE